MTTRATRASTVLLLSHSQDAHVPPVREALSRRGVDGVFLATDTFWSHVNIDFAADGDGIVEELRVGTRVLRGDEVSSIWYRRPQIPVVAPWLAETDARHFAEAESAAALHGTLRGLGAIWLSHPEAIRGASFKLPQLAVAQEVGFDIPRTCVSADPEVVRSFVRRIGGEVIVKLVSPGPPPLASNEGYNVFASLLNLGDLDDDRQIAACPAIYQEPVAKSFELRVTVVGDDVFACAIDSQATPLACIDWRRESSENIAHRSHRLPPHVEDRCRDLNRRYGLEFSAIDLIVTPEGRTVFLELNPNGQWLWIEEATGLPIADAIARRLAEARALPPPIAGRGSIAGCHR